VITTGNGSPAACDSTNALMPAWPLLASLARGRAMEDHVHLVDTVAEAAALVASYE